MNMKSKTAFSVGDQQDPLSKEIQCGTSKATFWNGEYDLYITVTAKKQKKYTTARLSKFPPQIHKI